MDIKKYISSGILELYVFGMLGEAERKEVEQNVLKYPEIKSELNKIEQSLELYADRFKMSPSAGLEKAIMDKVGQTPRELPLKPKGRGPFNRWTYLMVLLFLISLIAALFFFNNQKIVQTELEESKTNYQALEQDCNSKDQVIASLNNEIDLLLNPDNKRINMPGTDKAPNALASVFYNEKDRKTYLNVGNLPSPPTDRQYQLWALVDGQPVDMGVFDIVIDGDTVLLEVPFIENPGAFAVTLETLGGNPTPNLEELYVYGENT